MARIRYYGHLLAVGGLTAVLGWTGEAAPRPAKEAPPTKPESEMTDQELRERCMALWKKGPNYFWSGESGRAFDRCLCEVLKRGGKEWDSLLSEFWDSRPARGGMFTEAVLRTALCRVRKKPDPIEIRVLDGDEVRVTMPSWPRFRVSLANTDPDGIPIYAILGRRHMMGRWEEWRMVVTREDGANLPWKAESKMGVMVLDEPEPVQLKKDKEFRTVLRLYPYVQLSAPGRYTVRLQYHSAALPIAGLKDVSGLILCESKPFRLIVEGPTIKMTKKEVATARKAAADLKGTGPAKLLLARYGPAHASFAPADSPEGKLLALGWKAVPEMIASLDAPELTVDKRAWILGLLFSVTGLNDPRLDDGVLGDFSYRTASGPQSRPGGGGGLLGGSGSGSHTGRKIVPEKQRAFAQTWSEFGKAIKLKVSEKP